jgi:hypothetical protein
VNHHANLSRQTGDLKEYTVGVEAFRKPPDYDPKFDSSVRVQAGKLRRKLDEYYRTEAAPGEPRIEMPKGHFRLAMQATAAPPASPETRRTWLWLSAAVMLLAAGSAFWYATRPRGAAQLWNAEMEQLWSPLAAGSGGHRHTAVHQDRQRFLPRPQFEHVGFGCCVRPPARHREGAGRNQCGAGLRVYGGG